MALLVVKVGEPANVTETFPLLSISIRLRFVVVGHFKCHTAITVSQPDFSCLQDSFLWLSRLLFGVP